MSTLTLPGQREFLRKFLLALLSDPATCQGYFRRFEIKDLADFERLGYFGTYRLYRSMIEAAPLNPDDRVLDIGPWTGMECFLLAEAYHRVTVAEPDRLIARLIQSIARHYRTGDGRLAAEVLQVHQAGIGLKGNPPPPPLKRSVRFDASGAADITEVFGQHFADRIFCNHIIGVIPEEPRLAVLLSSLASYCSDRGVIILADSPAELTHALLEQLTFPDDSYPLEGLAEPGGARHPWTPYLKTGEIKKAIAPLLPGFSCHIRTVTGKARGIRQAHYLMVAERLRA